MPRKTLLAALAGVGLLLGFTGRTPTTPPPATLAEADPAAPEFAVSGPFVHDNLAVFLLHGPDTLPPRPVLTLDEALKAGTAVVHETGQVNTLCVENLSADSDLMMQNGDIVKGGRQDRVLRVAMILPPKSGPVAVESFCVEQSRWTNRGAEPATHFAANPGLVCGKDLKLAVNVGGQQGEVWRNVAAVQAQLTANNGGSVTLNASPTSLQLATENQDLQAKLAAYRAALANLPAGKPRVVGYAIAVNGKVTGAEVYGSRVLMAKAWTKAVNAAALEAFAEKKPAEYAAADAESVLRFMADASTPKDAQATRVAALDGRSEAARDLMVRNAGGNNYTGGTNVYLGQTTANAGTLTLTGANAYNGTTTLTGGIATLSGGSTADGMTSVPSRFTPTGEGGGRGGRAPRGPDAPPARLGEEVAALNQRAGNAVPTDQTPAAPPEVAITAVHGASADAITAVLDSPLPGGGQPANLTVVNGAFGTQFGGHPNPATLNTVGTNPPTNTLVVRGTSTNTGRAPAQAPQAAPNGVQPPPVQVNRVMGANGVLVESRDRANPGVIVHRTFIAK